MKKKILIVAAVMVCIAIAAAGTLAYFTSSTTAHNVITSGKIDIEVIETTTGGEPWPDGGVSGVMPGTSVVKNVSVKNLESSSEAWVRVKLTAKITGADGKSLSETGAIEYPVLTGWEKGDDGYYYYTKPLAPGKTTTNLIEEVKFLTGMGNAYQNCTVELNVSAEAVQTANNGATVLEAKGWPSETNG